MPLIRLLLRLFIVVAGAVLGLVLFLFALIAFVALMVYSVLRGRKPQMQFRPMSRNPWARHSAAPAAEDVVDVEVREVKDPAPLPLQPPRH